MMVTNVTLYPDVSEVHVETLASSWRFRGLDNYQKATKAFRLSRENTLSTTFDLLGGTTPRLVFTRFTTWEEWGVGDLQFESEFRN